MLQTKLILLFSMTIPINNLRDDKALDKNSNKKHTQYETKSFFDTNHVSVYVCKRIIKAINLVRFEHHIHFHSYSKVNVYICLYQQKFSLLIMKKLRNNFNMCVVIIRLLTFTHSQYSI